MCDLLQLQLNDYEIRKGKKIGVTISFNNHRLFVGNIPKNRDRDELLEEFTKHARKSNIKQPTNTRKKNFLFKKKKCCVVNILSQKNYLNFAARFIFSVLLFKFW